MSATQINWPSKRIPPGGLFHPPKVKYSQETSDLIKLLMEEAKMTMMVRKKINYHLRNGEPLPLIKEKPIKKPVNDGVMDIIRRMRVLQKKPLQAIIASGAYEQPRYRPKPDLREPAEEAKLRLQEKMCGMKIATTFLKAKPKPRKMLTLNLDPNDRIDEIIEEINERIEWLGEMDELGEGKKYREVIHSQIAEKLYEIKMLQKKMEKEKLNNVSKGKIS